MKDLSKQALLEAWLERFPLVEPPVTLGEETHHVFTERHLPIPQALIDEFITPYEKPDEADEFTEYIPCFRVEHTGKHHVCVYWRVSLMTYAYFLCTFSPEGKQISKSMIAGTYVTNDQLMQRVALINEEMEIFISEGASDLHDQEFDPTGSIKTHLEISHTGEIVYHTASDM